MNMEPKVVQSVYVIIFGIVVCSCGIPETRALFPSSTFPLYLTSNPAEDTTRTDGYDEEDAVSDYTTRMGGYDEKDTTTMVGYGKNDTTWRDGYDEEETTTMVGYDKDDTTWRDGYDEEETTTMVGYEGEKVFSEHMSSDFQLLKEELEQSFKNPNGSVYFVSQIANHIFELENEAAKQTRDNLQELPIPSPIKSSQLQYHQNSPGIKRNNFSLDPEGLTKEKIEIVYDAKINNELESDSSNKSDNNDKYGQEEYMIEDIDTIVSNNINSELDLDSRNDKSLISVPYDENSRTSERKIDSNIGIHDIVSDKNIDNHDVPDEVSGNKDIGNHNIVSDLLNLNRLTNNQVNNELTEKSSAKKGTRKCVKKVMMVEETDYDEVLTCDHSYDKRCHTSYVTKYEPHQEEVCEEKYKKECFIQYEQKAHSEHVNVCKTSHIKDCDHEGVEECQTIYQSECWTQQKVHLVEDDIPSCHTVQEEKCEDITVGYKTKKQCDTWPREVCQLEKKKVKKYTPDSICKKVPQKLCAPKDCQVKEGPVVCQDKMKTILVDNPVEECDIEPIRTCRFVTKLVPNLVASQECVDVPKEICARSKINPRKVKKPSIQNWCYIVPNNEECEKDADCPSGRYCYDKTCEECLTDDHCTNGYQCRAGQCRERSGKVLVKSISIETEECTDCSQENEGIQVELLGEKTVEFREGTPCKTLDLDHKNSQDFVNKKWSSFNGKEDKYTAGIMGSCFDAPLNAVLMDGGKLSWTGIGQFSPKSICVDWTSDNNYAWQCSLVAVSGEENIWEMDSCTDIDKVECSELF